ncbi:MAG: carboxypeptidase-like regulatory domain-containing protein [Flavobacteriales bacterium]|nr:carboxypeptidase-like regulatory domain-containing protein [Flavobacteriales bacterium]
MKSSIHILSISFWLMLVSSSCSAQDGFTTIRGTITDKLTSDPMILANVVLFEGEKQIGGVVSDFDGRYKFCLEKIGTYKLKVSYVGYELAESMDIEIAEDEEKTVDLVMKGGVELPEVVVEASVDYRIISCGFGVETIYGSRITTELPKEPVISNFGLYPNPASSQITLDLLNLKEEPLSLRILDSSGRIVLEQKQLPLSRLSIPLDGLSNGVYFASVQLKDKLLTERFVVAK